MISVADGATCVLLLFVLSFYNDSDSAMAPHMRRSERIPASAISEHSVPHNSSMNTKQGDNLRTDERIGGYEDGDEGKGGPPSAKAGHIYRLSLS
jgi:hypothetical protein